MATAPLKTHGCPSGDTAIDRFFQAEQDAFEIFREAMESDRPLTGQEKFIVSRLLMIEGDHNVQRAFATFKHRLGLLEIYPGATALAKEKEKLAELTRERDEVDARLQAKIRELEEARAANSKPVVDQQNLVDKMQQARDSLVRFSLPEIVQAELADAVSEINRRFSERRQKLAEQIHQANCLLGMRGRTDQEIADIFAGGTLWRHLVIVHTRQPPEPHIPLRTYTLNRPEFEKALQKAERDLPRLQQELADMQAAIDKEIFEAQEEVLSELRIGQVPCGRPDSHVVRP